MNLEMYNLRFIDNMMLFKKIAPNYGQEEFRAPTVFIGNNAYTGYSNEIENQIKSQVKVCKQQGCVSPKDKKYDPSEHKSYIKTYFMLAGALLVVALLVKWFVKKQLKSISDEIKPSTKKFME